MSRTLMLMRHAKSSWDAPVKSDAQRMLSKRGRRDAPRMGDWMANNGLIPDLVLCSPAVRARQTAEAVLERLDLPASSIHFDQRIYAANIDTLLKVVASCPNDAQCVLMVGHNPGLDDLCLYLCGTQIPLSKQGKLMTTAALADIELPGDWSNLASRSGKLRQLMRPKELDW